MNTDRSITDDDTTWRDWYDGAEELADHLERIAERRGRAGDYDAANHLMAASWALREMDERIAEAGA